MTIALSKDVIDQLTSEFYPDPHEAKYQFTNQNASDRNRFILLMEDEILNSKQIKRETKCFRNFSPYRYPGGKSRIMNELYKYLDRRKTRLLVSPYTGGASFELAMLAHGIVDNLYLNDLDFGVYSFWLLTKKDPESLIKRIERITPNHDMFFELRAKILTHYRDCNHLDAAWASIVVNRLAYSGIAKAYPIGGKNGDQKQLLCRWNPKTLIDKIRLIHNLSDKYRITNLDALEVIEEKYWVDDATIFIDPPYVSKGKRLYPYYYEEKDHIALANLLDTLYIGSPGADIIVTYDYSEWLSNLYKHPQKKILPRIYSA